MEGEKIEGDPGFSMSSESLVFDRYLIRDLRLKHCIQ